MSDLTQAEIKQTPIEKKPCKIMQRSYQCHAKAKRQPRKTTQKPRRRHTEATHQPRRRHIKATQNPRRSHARTARHESKNVTSPHPYPHPLFCSFFLRNVIIITDTRALFDPQGPLSLKKGKKEARRKLRGNSTKGEEQKKREDKKRTATTTSKRIN